ncbi:unnamed protein product [Trichogramma brassicae]|uniref:Peptidase aspartic putative domain-containing protein n=1 Tax=Trichogramma brassicae TaxID=86971 RepID=A0A6H5HRN5_9HYME|nr:unnamed protein product [Trichogramma brassicae]
MEQLKIRWAEFEAAHKRLEEDSDVGPDDPYFKEDKYDKTYEAFLMNLGLFQDRLLKVKAETLRLGTQPAADGKVNDMDVNRTKLPAIVIGDFSGDIQDWVRFRDTFREMVIERPNLPNIFKMNYLRSYVKGEAAELLQEVPSGGDHFATAWQVLLSHYDNKRLLINKLMTKLMSLPAMANDSATELMRVLNGVRNLLQALKALGSPIDQWDHFTVFLTRSKISPKCQSKWEDSLMCLPTITSYQPSCRDTKKWPHLKGLQLADPNFERPGRIDVLLSTQIHARVIQEGLRKGDDNAPIAMKSRLGWILSGRADKTSQGGTIVCLQTNGQLDDLLRSFWEIEEPPRALPWSTEDKLCEEHYKKNTVRLSDGRYQVRLPKKLEAPIDWVNSRQIARSCLLSLERKFVRNPKLRTEYSTAIAQMIESDQMRKVAIEPQDYGAHYFLPHHAVVKESSTTTRVRPVFNASARNAAGHSLNENLMTGPNLLPQLVLVLAHWRCYPIAFVADVSKMYLQVRLHPDDWARRSKSRNRSLRSYYDHVWMWTLGFPGQSHSTKIG